MLASALKCLMLLSGNTHTQKFVVSNFCKLQIPASQQVNPVEAISVDKSQQDSLSRTLAVR